MGYMKAIRQLMQFTVRTIRPFQCMQCAEPAIETVREFAGCVVRGESQPDGRLIYLYKRAVASIFVFLFFMGTMGRRSCGTGAAGVVHDRWETLLAVHFL